MRNHDECGHLASKEGTAKPDPLCEECNPSFTEIRKMISDMIDQDFRLWECTGCHRRFAEYSNGCPSCSTREKPNGLRKNEPVAARVLRIALHALYEIQVGSFKNGKFVPMDATTCREVVDEAMSKILSQKP